MQPTVLYCTVLYCKILQNKLVSKTRLLLIHLRRKWMQPKNNSELTGMSLLTQVMFIKPLEDPCLVGACLFQCYYRKSRLNFVDRGLGAGSRMYTIQISMRSNVQSLLLLSISTLIEGFLYNNMTHLKKYLVYYLYSQNIICQVHNLVNTVLKTVFFKVFTFFP